MDPESFSLVRKEVSKEDMELLDDVKSMLKDEATIKDVKIAGSCETGTGLAFKSDLDLWIIVHEEYSEDEFIEKIGRKYQLEMIHKRNRILLQLKRPTHPPTGRHYHHS